MTRVNRETRGLYEVYQELKTTVSEMNYTVDAVIVEGRHDKKTLNLLGYTETVILCSRRSDVDLVDSVSRNYSQVVILTDFDEEGCLINKRYTRLLEERRVKVSRFYRRRFEKLLKKAKITTIEGIYSIKLSLGLYG